MTMVVHDVVSILDAANEAHITTIDGALLALLVPSYPESRLKLPTSRIELDIVSVSNRLQPRKYPHGFVGE
jgi:hypothetical protein